MATFRPSLVSWAAQTVPMPPRPSLRMSSYLWIFVPGVSWKPSTFSEVPKDPSTWSCCMGCVTGSRSDIGAAAGTGRPLPAAPTAPRGRVARARLSCGPISATSTRSCRSSVTVASWASGAADAALTMDSLILPA